MNIFSHPGPDAPDEVNAKASPVAYDRDYYGWALEQAAFLAAGDFKQLDLVNLAEEVGDLARSEFRAYASAYRIVLLHMLKWDHQPERRSRSWWTSITLQRGRLADIIAENPSLKPRTDEAIARAYREARLLAANETGLDLAGFPEPCPYDVQTILTRRFDLP